MTVDESVFMYRARIPGEDTPVPMISVITVTNGEVETRMDRGEFSGDVVDEYTTSLWFTDRSSFRVAWRVAREIVGGKSLPALFEAGMLHRVALTGAVRSELTVMPSAHHVAEGAA